MLLPQTLATLFILPISLTLLLYCLKLYPEYNGFIWAILSVIIHTILYQACYLYLFFIHGQTMPAEHALFINQWSSGLRLHTHLLILFMAGIMVAGRGRWMREVKK